MAQVNQGMISKGITLKIGDLVVTGLQSTPEISESKEKLETTTLANANKTYIDGLKDFGDSLSFSCLYLKDEFLAVRQLADGEGKEVELKYPDGMTVTFTGSVSTVLSGAEVNSVLTYSIEITPMSDIVITDSEEA